MSSVNSSFPWCFVCGRFVPRDDLCRHVFWCDACGGWAGSGAAESTRCRHSVPDAEMAQESHRTILEAAKDQIMASDSVWTPAFVHKRLRASMHPFRSATALVFRRDGALLACFRRRIRSTGGVTREWSLYGASGEFVATYLFRIRYTIPEIWADRLYPQQADFFQAAV